MIMVMGFIALLLAGTVTPAQAAGRVERYKITVSDTARLLGSCGDFDIVYDDVMLISGAVRYDAAGVPVQELQHFQIVGQTLYYNSSDPTKSVLGGPGEVEHDRIIYVNGAPALDLLAGLSWKIVLEGYGPIYVFTGHTILDLQTGQWIFTSAPNTRLPQEMEALCDALR